MLQRNVCLHDDCVFSSCRKVIQVKEHLVPLNSENVVSCISGGRIEGFHFIQRCHYFRGLE